MPTPTHIPIVLPDGQAPLTGDTAVETCGENMLTGLPVTDADPTPGLAGGRAVATNVFRRTPSGWRLLVHHASPVLAGGEQE
jgi:hypothetical protein